MFQSQVVPLPTHGVDRHREGSAAQRGGGRHGEFRVRTNRLEGRGGPEIGQSTGSVPLGEVAGGVEREGTVGVVQGVGASRRGSRRRRGGNGVKSVKPLGGDVPGPGVALALGVLGDGWGSPPVGVELCPETEGVEEKVAEVGGGGRGWGMGRGGGGGRDDGEGGSVVWFHVWEVVSGGGWGGDRGEEEMVFQRSYGWGSRKQGEIAACGFAHRIKERRRKQRL